MSLVMIVPTRGRPGSMAELAEAWSAPGVTELAETVLLFVVDSDDPDLPAYEQVYATSCEPVSANLRLMTFSASQPANGRLAEILNTIALNIAPDFVGFMGDDHRPRTLGWDRKIVEALTELGTGIVYGDDKIQGINLPTAVAMTGDIPYKLGYMVPPNLRHMFLDNFWRDIGSAIGRLRYLPDVVIEHLHPVAGRAQWDAGYLSVASHMSPDQAAYLGYLKSTFEIDVAKLKELL